jgi:hypothetical protein
MAPAMIATQRARFKEGLNALLDCDELWNDKLSRDIAEQANDEANNNLDVAINDREHYGEELVEKHLRQMFRDLLAISMVSEVLVKWAKAER